MILLDMAVNKVYYNLIKRVNSLLLTMSIVWKGGPGAKAPYETTHVRIPVPLKERVQALSDAYKLGTLEQLPLEYSQAVKEAKAILRPKKNSLVKTAAKTAMESLLTAIYKVDTRL